MGMSPFDTAEGGYYNAFGDCYWSWDSFDGAEGPDTNETSWVRFAVIETDVKIINMNGFYGCPNLREIIVAGNSTKVVWSRIDDLIDLDKDYKSAMKDIIIFVPAGSEAERNVTTLGLRHRTYKSKI